MTVEKLHTEYGGYLLKCLRLYGVPESECEDVRQDIYLKLLEKKCDLSKVKTPKGFCATIARNAAIDFLRKAGSAPEVESLTVIIDGEEKLHPGLNKIAVAQWEAIIGNTNMERIQEAIELAQLYDLQDGGPTAYEVIEDLLYGLNMKQIGEKHGVSRHTVSRWLQEWYAWINSQIPR